MLSHANSLQVKWFNSDILIHSIIVRLKRRQIQTARRECDMEKLRKRDINDMEKMFTGGGSQNDSRAREQLTRQKAVAKV